jgi:hypothetical protein
MRPNPTKSEVVRTPVDDRQGKRICAAIVHVLRLSPLSNYAARWPERNDSAEKR